MLASLGDEWTYRKVFNAYLSLLATRKDGENILIDNTGLPNSIRFPLTAISNHNGKISNEVRLIYVVQQKTNLPLYFICVPGNIIDVSTLTKTMLELKAYKVDTKFAVLDAGYLTIMVSSKPIAVDQILPKYYIRSKIEQVFDICKNNTNMLPLRVQSEETFSGHLLIAFLASVIVRMLQNDLAKASCTPESALLALRNHKCKVFDDQILTMESARKENDIYKIFKMKVPHVISSSL